MTHLRETNPKRTEMATGEQRRKVRALAGFGVRQEDICAIMGLRSPKTLRKRFAKELELGVVEATAKVAQAAFKLAISGRDPASTMFWLERRARWGGRDTTSDARDEVFDVVDWEPEPEEAQVEDTRYSGVIFEEARPKAPASGDAEL